MTELFLLAALGLAAGALTTLTGVGGGLLLLLALALWFDPGTALAVTAPALLAGNLHRLFLFRRHLDARIAGRLALGAVPGALLGGALAVQLPHGVLRGLLLGATALALAKALGWIRWRPPASAVVPVAAVGGFITATSGGGGLLVPPLLLSMGLTGPAYLATTALSAAAMHIARLTAYGAGGWMDATRWALAGALALAIPVGNLLGRALRERVPAGALERFTHATLVVVCGLAVAGVSR
ncbi:MAG: TSUP family transporter [Myxococcales bacterium]|nr:TSUP family transporter [Myxococcales bacterium]MCB9648719.1 TSUP family transporter [Deltaproteobacteria bacterium]